MRLRMQNYFMYLCLMSTCFIFGVLIQRADISTCETKVLDKRIQTSDKASVANQKTTQVSDGLKNKTFEINSNEKSDNYMFEILWWNEPMWLKYEHQDMSMCKYSNCRITTERKQIESSDAVIFSILPGFGGNPSVFTKKRNPKQVWIFFKMETPTQIGDSYKNPVWRNMFNWSWSYRIDADIVQPYGKLVKLDKQAPKNYSEIFKRKTKSSAWLVSHCKTKSRREDFVDILRRYTPVYIHGGCGNESTPDYIMKIINDDYKFYLAFENSLCKDYITEKFFSYFKLDVVPVVRGGGPYAPHAPKNTFIDTRNFKTINELGKFLNDLGNDEKRYTAYLKEKNKYSVNLKTGPLAMCKICEKLNKLDGNKRVYKDIVPWIDQCYPIKDLREH